MLAQLMCRDLNIDISTLKHCQRNSSFYYKHYAIPKKNGGKRLISHPSPVLKAFQYWLINNIFKHFPISPYATAYFKGSSIAHNARKHLNSRYILHLDIENFFPSINEAHVTKALVANKKIVVEKLNINLSDEDIKLINSLVLCKGVLTIGSPSSPIISNIIMRDIDEEIKKIADKHAGIYTRYADDMIISSNKYLNKSIIKDVQIVLLLNNFRLNNDKIYFMSPKARKVITGVNVNNDRLTIGREKRDLIKSMVYKKLKYGEGDNNVIQGYLSHLKNIDPYYYSIILRKYPGVLELLRQ